MNPLIWLGAGGLAAYLYFRHRAASTTTDAPQTPEAPAGPGPSLPAPQTPMIIVAPPSAGPAAPIVTSAPGDAQALQPAPVVLTGRWGWPVPRWEGRAPVISDGYGSNRPPGKHLGVDIMFGRIQSDRFPIGPNGTKAFVMPDAWMAVSAADGVLWSAGYTPRGAAVLIDHGNVATFYQHLDTLFVPAVQPPAKGTPRALMIQIKAGQPLGVIGADPLDPQHIKHLHFELRVGTDAVDPAGVMKAWQVFTPRDIAPFLPPLTRNAASRSDLVHVRGHERRWPGTALHPPR